MLGAPPIFERGFMKLNNGFREICKELAINNLRSFAIHATVSVVALIFFMIFGFMGMGISAVLALMFYVVFGCRFLVLLPRFNFISVLGILILFGLMYGIPYALSLTSPSVDDDLYHTLISLGQLGLFNLPSIEAVGSFFVVVLGYNYDEVSSYPQLVHFLAAFVPPFFMYIGLLLRMLLHKRDDTFLHKKSGRL